MRIYVTYMAGFQLRAAQGVPHGPQAAISSRSHAGDVVRVCAHPVSDDLRQDDGVPRPGMFQFLENQNAGALADHKPIAVLVKWTAGMFRVCGSTSW